MIRWKDRRRERRKGLAMSADIKSLTAQANAIVCDLSEHGCRINNAGLTLQTGSRVLIRPLRSQSLLGTVRWSSSDAAGIEFDVPLHPALVAELISSHPDKYIEVALDIAA